jgi:hypothetical protein
MQADTFFAENETSPGFAAIVARLEQRAAQFTGPVLLIKATRTTTSSTPRSRAHRKCRGPC